MNIFVLDKDPMIAAQMQCDKHVVKMILETAQLLCSAHWLNGGEAPYRLTHKNHPCSIWTRESISNYRWLVKHGLALCEEYTKRYKKIHKTESVIEWLRINEPRIRNIGVTPFPLAMPNECKMGDVVSSYRNYYICEKKDIAKWNFSKKPSWFIY